MTHDQEPCQLVPNMANDFNKSIATLAACLLQPNLKKRQAKPNPNDSWLGTLSIGPKYG